MGATQFAIFKLKHGADIDDPSTQAGKMYRETARSAAMQEGFQGQYFGRKIEDPDTLVWILNWESVEAHHRFMQTEGYPAVIEQLKEILEFSSPAPLIFHAQFQPHPPKALDQNHTVELAIFHTKIGASEQDDVELFDLATRSVPAIVDVADTVAGPHSVDVGWVVEDMEWEGQTSRALAYMPTWDSRQHHLDFRGTESFKKAVVPMRAYARGISVWHVDVQKF